MHNNSRTKLIRELIASVAVLCLLPAIAGAVVVNGPVVTMSIDAGGHSATWSVELPAPTDNFDWSLPSPVDIYSEDPEPVYLATVDLLSITGDTDPFVALAFAVTAGAVPTNFSIFSGNLAITPINNGLAFASAGITVTDLDSSPLGATVTGLFPGTKSYQARYNAGGFVFANLVSPVTAPTDDTAIGTQRHPSPTGRVVVPGLTTDIESEFHFTLTANDSASGTSRFDIIVPEPSSVVLAACGVAAVALCAWRKRRRA
jgi:hypothetical protein